MGLHYIVRQATPDDCGDIIRLIRELAEFDGKNPDLAVRNSEQDLREDGFGDHAFYHCLVVEATDKDSPDDQPAQMVAFAMYYFTYSSWAGRFIYLEDLYIQPAHRGKGLGKGLMVKIAKIGAEKGCKGLRGVVQENNQSARRFYEQLNACNLTQTGGWMIYASRGNAFEELVNCTESVSNIEFFVI